MPDSPPSTIDQSASLDARDKSATRTRTASFPFNDPKADLIIRSSDNIHFYVHKSLLSIVSPVFEDMFGLPTDTSQELYDDRPCLPVSDDSRHLLCLLSRCDPRCNKPPSTLNHLAMMLEITDKYGVDFLFEHAQQDLLAHDSVQAEPLRVYAIAIRFRLDKVAQRAAKATLLVSLAGCYNSPQLKHISAFALQNLHNYHFKCRTAVQALLASDSWVQEMKTAARYLMSCEEDNDQSHTHGVEYFLVKRVLITEKSALWLSTGRTASWWSAYVNVMMNNLNEQPSGFSVPRLSEYNKLQQLIALDECRKCKKYGRARLNVVTEYLSDKIDEAVSKVVFEVKY